MDTLYKWIATVLIVVGSFVNSLGYYPLGPIILVLGGFFWLIVSIMWKEKAMITTNLVVILVTIIGLVANYL